jgi:hypothetical protein
MTEAGAVLENRRLVSRQATSLGSAARGGDRLLAGLAAGVHDGALAGEQALRAA